MNFSLRVSCTTIDLSNVLKKVAFPSKFHIKLCSLLSFVNSTLGMLLSAGLFLQNYLLDLPISGSCGYSTVYTPSQEYSVS